ncbi:MAG: type II toxin-antitoxin system PemK/MazF family toxin [Phormidesmis sp.]|nr:type II toxin-antitoxin system PemK/MazF family toxin [Leptolyngbya sp. BC1307]
MMTPKRGEVWLVNLDPTLGSEIKKTRPAIVVSADKIGKLPVKLVVPITDWKANFAQNVWHIKMHASASNGLSKVSAADTLQMRSIALQRFVRKLGDASSQTMTKVVISIDTIIAADS